VRSIPPHDSADDDGTVLIVGISHYPALWLIDFSRGMSRRNRFRRVLSRRTTTTTTTTTTMTTARIQFPKADPETSPTNRRFVKDSASVSS
jgi:hypothetical protein